MGHVAVQKPQCTHLRRIASASRPSGVSLMKSARLVCIGQKSAIHAAGVEDRRAGSKVLLEALVELHQRRAEADGTRRPSLVAAAEKRRVAARARRGFAHRGRHRCRPRASAARRSIRRAAAPARSSGGAVDLSDTRHSGAPLRKKSQALLAHGRPERAAVGDVFAAEPRARRAHRGLGAREPHVERVVRRGRSRVIGQRLAGPGVHELDRLRLRHAPAAA